MEYVVLVIVGFITGLFGGLLGIGGSVIVVPGMFFILGSSSEDAGDRLHQYIATAMIVTGSMAIPASIGHFLKRAVKFKVWIYLMPMAVIGVLLGCKLSWLLRGDSTKYLRWTLIVFLGYVVLHNLKLIVCKESLGDNKVGREVEQKWLKLVIGLGTGLLSGLLGIGGGSLAVPAQQIFLGIPLRNAIATSSATMAVIAWVGAATKNIQLGDNNVTGHIFLWVLCLAPMAMVGGYIGSQLTHILSDKVVRSSFVLLLMVGIIKLFVT